MHDKVCRVKFLLRFWLIHIHTWLQIWNTPKRWTKLSNFSSGPPGHESLIMLHMYIWENKAQLSQSPHQWHPLPRALLLTPHVLYCICNAHIRIHTSSSTLTPQSRSDRECDGLSGLSGPLTTDYFYWLLTADYFYYWLPPAFAPLCLPSDSHLTQYLYSVCLQAEDSSSCFALLQKSLC